MPPRADEAPMRLLLALLLLAPLAAAQAPPPVITIQAAPPPMLDAATGAPSVVPVTITFACPATGALPTGFAASLAITRIPAWAAGTVDPATFRVEPTECVGGGQVARQANLTLRATPAAPAFTPETMELRATLDGGGSSTSARSTMQLVASYAPRLVLTPDAFVKRAPENGIVTFVLRVQNDGNGLTKAILDVTDVDDALVVRDPPPVTIGVGDSTLVPIQVVHATNATGGFTIRYHPQYALDARLVGAADAITLTVSPGDVADAVQERATSATRSPVPGFAFPGALAALFLAALAKRHGL